MNEIKAKILINSGINEETELLDEGIVFFKNSKKIKRLSRTIVKKADKLARKGKSEEANSLARFAKEANKVANRFEQLEKEFSIFGSKDEKEDIKARYEDVSQEFSELLKIAKEDSFKRAATLAKGLVVVASILFAGGLIINGMEQNAGVFTNAVNNLGARIANTKKTTGSPGVMAREAGEKIARGIVIRQTNDDLAKAALATGATIGSAIGATALNDMKKAGVRNKTITDTVRVIEDLKSQEDKKYKGRRYNEQETNQY